jgi:hypothetical protein
LTLRESHARPSRLRVVDAGAVFAGWVGLGMSVMVVIGLELIVAVQTLPLLFAPIGGLLVGYYANARSARRRPWARVAANAAYAGLVTGVSLAVLYALIRLLFMYADSGYGGGPGQGQLRCTTGPDCSYQRYVTAGRAEELRAAGVVDAATFERYFLGEQGRFALVLVGVSLAGALGGGLLYGATTRGASATPAVRAASPGRSEPPAIA